MSLTEDEYQERMDAAFLEAKRIATIAITGGAFRETKHTSDNGNEQLSFLDVHNEFIRRHVEQQIEDKRKLPQRLREYRKDGIHPGICTEAADAIGLLMNRAEKAEIALIDADCHKVPVSADVVNHPSHYTQGSIEVIDAIESLELGFHAGNVLKYVSRYKHKGGVEDLRKAEWYLKRLIEKEETNESKSSKRTSLEETPRTG